jgi:hypothetical protein
VFENIKIKCMNERKILFMVNIKETKGSITAPKRNIIVKGAIIKDLPFVDETGDVTAQVVEQIPESLETIDVKISIELPSEDE